jgi:hypothetical protein
MRSAASWRRCAAFLVIAPCLVAGDAAAGPEDEGAVDVRPAASGERSVSSGSFAPWGMSARSDAQRALVHLQGGYDAARGGALFETMAEAQVLGGLSLRAGSSYVEGSDGVRPRLGLKLDVVRQEAAGVDLAVAGTYEGHGFNQVPAAVFTAAVGGAVGRTRLWANASYGQGLELDERHGDLRLGAFHRVRRGLHLGLDSRMRVDLERDATEPSGEPDWDLVAGPAAALSLGRFVVTGTVGASAVKMRAGGPVRTGAVATTGVGAAF